MAGGKEFVFGFKIAAALQGNFNAAFSSASSQMLKLNEKAREYKEIMKSVSNAEKQGTITKVSYDNAMKILERNYQKVIQQQKRYLSVQGKVNEAQSAMMKHGVNFLQYKEMALGLAAIAEPAIKFESAMADVKKVVDFDTPEQFNGMSQDIIKLSTQIPMTANGLAQIVASGGQAGIAKEELTGFAEAAAKMGVAFDITAEQAGDMMAQWRTAFKMNQTQVVDLADKINYLGNTTAASAPLISDVVQRIGSLGEVGGMASGEIAALGASIVATGTPAEVAATGIKNLMLGMVAGESATKSQAAAFESLGLNATDMAKRMQNDATGAIFEVLSRIQGLDKYKPASVLKDLFGSESIGAIAPLLSNMDNLRENLMKVADKTKYAGSMEDEFAARAATTENALQLMNNKLDAAKIAIGSGLIPTIAPVIEYIGELASGFSNFATGNTELISSIGLTTFGIVGLSAAASAAAWVWNGLKLAMGGANLMMTTLKNTTLLFSTIQRSGTATTGLLTGAQWAWNVALSANPIGAVIVLLSALTVAGIYCYNNYKEFAEFLSLMWNDPIAAIEQFTSSVFEKIGGMINWLREKWETVSGILSTPIWGGIGESVIVQPAAPDENVGTMGLADGGIYNKGSFLTTFAEESGESAIPHTPNRRNIGLLAKTNEIMGSPLGGGNIQASFAPVITINGNADSNTVSQLNQTLNDTLAEFERKLQALQNQKARVSYT